MAGMQDGKAFKQDMVVSIRYRNDLPPPPMPPKLLDIEHGGLQQYLTTGYASTLSRREEPNIDADAEGGMQIDMVGIPGYFLGDESAIMAPELQPVMDPEDSALMLTLDQLKTEGAKLSGHSFLRKTQYMTSSGSRANFDASRPTPRARKMDGKPIIQSREDPEVIKRHVQKSFDLAYPSSIPFNAAKGDPVTSQEREAWSNPVHPENPRLKPVGFYPVLPDLEAVDDGGGKFTYVKFSKPPLPAHHDRRDDRVDVSFMAALENKPLMRQWQARKEAFDRDPAHYDDPGPEPLIWSLHVPKSREAVPKVRKIFNDADPAKDTPEWFTELSEVDVSNEMRIPFTRVRHYPSVETRTYDDRRIMVMSLYDPDSAPSHSRLRDQGRAAYYYPLMRRLKFNTDRSKIDQAHINARGGNPEDDDLTRDLPDDIMILPREPTALEKYGRLQNRGKYDYAFKAKFDELEKEANAEAEAMEAGVIEDEQGTLQPGAQDVSMAEVEAAGDMDIRPITNGDRPDRDDQDDDGDADLMEDD